MQFTWKPLSVIWFTCSIRSILAGLTRICCTCTFLMFLAFLDLQQKSNDMISIHKATNIINSDKAELDIRSHINTSVWVEFHSDLFLCFIKKHIAPHIETWFTHSIKLNLILINGLTEIFIIVSINWTLSNKQIFKIADSS